MENQRKDGRLENFIPQGRAVTVSMPLAEYEAERARWKKQGFDSGAKQAYRHLSAVFRMIREATYDHSILVNTYGIPDDEFIVLQNVTKILDDTFNGPRNEVSPS
jgi:hypothetical protein